MNFYTLNLLLWYLFWSSTSLLIDKQHKPISHENILLTIVLIKNCVNYSKFVLCNLSITAILIFWGEDIRGSGDSGQCLHTVNSNHSHQSVANFVSGIHLPPYPITFPPKNFSVTPPKISSVLLHSQVICYTVHVHYL